MEIGCAKRIRLDLVFWGLPDSLRVGLSDAGFVQLPFATEIFLISRVRACAEPYLIYIRLNKMVKKDKENFHRVNHLESIIYKKYLRLKPTF